MNRSSRGTSFSGRSSSSSSSSKSSSGLMRRVRVWALAASRMVDIS